MLLRRWGWLGGHDASIVADTLYRSLLGRPPSAPEREAIRHRLAEGADVAVLARVLTESDEGADVVMARNNAASRSVLRRRFAGGPDATPVPRLVFLHIMRVGGTSMSVFLDRLVPDGRSRVHLFLDDIVFAPPPILAQLRVIAGHIPYGALPLIPQPFSTLCVLRDPYTRTLSHLTHLRAVSDHHRDLSLEEFVFSDEFDVPSGNYQARQLAHDFDIEGAWRTYSPEHRYQARGGDPLEDHPVQSLFDSTSVGWSDEELLQRAMANLGQVDYVGVTDQLDLVAAPVARLFGATANQIARLNRSEPVPAPEIDARIRRRIDERTPIDRELYAMAATRGRERI
jgi:hypothetical protein